MQKGGQTLNIADTSAQDIPLAPEDPRRKRLIYIGIALAVIAGIVFVAPSVKRWANATVSVPFERVRGAEEVARQLGGALVKKSFDARTLQVKIHKMIVEGDTAVVQQTLSATTLAGDRYENEYCWVYTCRDGGIATIEEYVDTWKAAAILKW